MRLSAAEDQVAAPAAGRSRVVETKTSGSPYVACLGGGDEAVKAAGRGLCGQPWESGRQLRDSGCRGNRGKVADNRGTAAVGATVGRLRGGALRR